MFTTVNIFSVNPAFNQTANVGNRPQNIFTDNYKNQPFGLMTDVPCLAAVPQSAHPFGQREFSIGLNEKLLRQMKSQQSKLEKVREKFDTNYDQLSASMKEAVADVYNLIAGYKNLISEQNKSLSQIAIDFQQQTAKMVRSFRDSIIEIENSYKMAMTNAISPTAYVQTTSPRSARRQNKIQITTPSTDFTSEDSGEEAIRNFLIWRRQQKSNRRRQRYADNNLI